MWGSLPRSVQLALPWRFCTELSREFKPQPQPGQGLIRQPQKPIQPGRATGLNVGDPHQQCGSIGVQG